MKRVLTWAVGVAAVIALTGTTGLAATVNVDVGPNGSMSFSPNPVSIHVGDTVLWTWKSSFHSVTASAGDFDSGVQFQPFTYSHTFSAPGSFGYYCSYHGAASMSGSVEVAAAPASPT